MKHNYVEVLWNWVLEMFYICRPVLRSMQGTAQAEQNMRKVCVSEEQQVLFPRWCSVVPVSGAAIDEMCYRNCRLMPSIGAAEVTDHLRLP